MAVVAPEAPLDEDMALATRLAHILIEKKARDVVILDMRDRIAYADAFVLCTGTSPRHVRAIADGVRRIAKTDMELTVGSIEGTEAGRWVLVDLGGIIVHVFDEPMRGFYNLDGLWVDVPRIELPDGDSTIEAPQTSA
jgi:ribosome-associated protein